MVVSGYTGKYLCDENQGKSRLQNDMGILGPLRVLDISWLYIGYGHSGEQSQMEAILDSRL